MHARPPVGPFRFYMALFSLALFLLFAVVMLSGCAGPLQTGEPTATAESAAQAAPTDAPLPAPITAWWSPGGETLTVPGDVWRGVWMAQCERQPEIVLIALPDGAQVWIATSDAAISADALRQLPSAGGDCAPPAAPPAPPAPARAPLPAPVAPPPTIPPSPPAPPVAEPAPTPCPPPFVASCAPGSTNLVEVQP